MAGVILDEETALLPEMNIRRRSVPFSRIGWAAYALGWLTFALCFAAASWMRAGGPSWSVLSAALLVMSPAALLGVAVVFVCTRIDLVAVRSVATIAPHVAGAVLFPILWIAAVSALSAAIRGLDGGGWSWGLPPAHVVHWHTLTGILIYVTVAAVTCGLLFTHRSEEMRKRAERQLVRAQLNPHFLFNTLHALFALARSDADAGEAGVDRLSRVLRYALRTPGDDIDEVSLADEWSFALDVICLEKLRVGERIRWHADLSLAALECAIAPVLLQPLVENALRHAVGPCVDGATLSVEAAVREGMLRLRVSDDGPGSAPEVTARSSGLGLRSIRSRLAGAAGGSGRLDVDTAPGAGFTATITLPARRWRSRS